jgi:hypothetical protein
MSEVWGRMWRGVRDAASHVRGGQSLGAILDNQSVLIADSILSGWRSNPPTSIADAEFRVFSQWGEDGVIQWLTRSVATLPRTFVELGVESYRESNTRFLLTHDHYRGVIVDAGEEHVRFTRKRGLAWRHDLDAVSAFVTKDNVNEIISSVDLTGEIGVFSLDLDGVDYWVLDALHVVQPQLVVCEYNALFGPTAAVTVPYRPDFDRTKAHPSGVYFGCSLAALHSVLEPRGYRLVGCTTSGVNAFWVHEAAGTDVSIQSVEQAFRACGVRQERDRDGELTYRRADATLMSTIAPLPLVDVRDGSTTTVGSVAS